MSILTYDQLALVQQKKEANQLLFALLLKSYEYTKLFIEDVTDLPEEMISLISEQLGININFIATLTKRSLRTYKAQIKEFFKFKKTDSKTETLIKEWLTSDIFPKGSIADAQALGLTRSYLIKQKIHPYSNRMLLRIINSARLEYEDKIFHEINVQISDEQKEKLFSLLDDHEEKKISNLGYIKQGPAGISRNALSDQIERLDFLHNITIPDSIALMSRKTLMAHYKMLCVQYPSQIKRFSEHKSTALLSIFCHIQKQLIIDQLTESLILLIKRLRKRAENKIKKLFEPLSSIKKTINKNEMLYDICVASVGNPDTPVKDAIYPSVELDKMQKYIKEYEGSKIKSGYYGFIHHLTRKSYGNHFRKVLSVILARLDIQTNNACYHEMLAAIKLIQKHLNSTTTYYPIDETVPLDGVIKPDDVEIVTEMTKEGERINRIDYEICVLKMIQERIKCKDLWIKGAYVYRNPEEDLPADFETNKEFYFNMLELPSSGKSFVQDLQKDLKHWLAHLDTSLNNESKDTVVIQTKPYGQIYVPKLKPQAPPQNIAMIKKLVTDKWESINLLDILKEADLTIEFTKDFINIGGIEKINREELQQRILLALFGYGTNTGLKRVSSGNENFSYSDLRYTRLRYLDKDNIQHAIAQVVNKVFEVRDINIWGDGTNTVSSDSKRISAYEHNLMTEWHPRYHNTGIMIYWHVDEKSACIHSQLQKCTSSEVAAMMHGVLHHYTSMKVKRNYADTHGGSEPAFGFSGLLNFELFIRFKNIAHQKLFIVDSGDKATYTNIQPATNRVINWELIENNYEMLVKYAAAVKTGTASTEVLMKRFSSNNYHSALYKAMCELGKVYKTIFLCKYLSSPELRQEITERLNIVERWNGINDFIFYGKAGEICTNREEDQEIAILSLHLLQMCMVYINTLLIQEVIQENDLLKVLTKEDLRAITPILHEHINPYGIFPLNMQKRIPINNNTLEDAA